MQLPTIAPAQLCTCHLKGDTPRVCSHVAAQKTKKGQPLFTDLKALEKAISLNHCEIVHTNAYNWWGHHVGDYPIPEGMTKEELGSNALFIIRVKEPMRSELRKEFGGEPYDIGVLADPNNEGCYTIIYDFYAQRGLDKLLGAPVKNEKGEITMLCPLLKQTYDMVCESLGAQEAGDNITVLSLEQARQAYPEFFGTYPKQQNEGKTWVSVANTKQRLGVH